ncbi:unnamed protein product [Echinostoma caproni]|uniref:Uncharacterized protein n=1 Tax=Echinostoma caproni TaxID=27848 RepID=A0A183A1Y4_9TREM|nr:unnamed protein product [Echinostoma caproni]
MTVMPISGVMDVQDLLFYFRRFFYAEQLSFIQRDMICDYDERSFDLSTTDLFGTEFDRTQRCSSGFWILSHRAHQQTIEGVFRHDSPDEDPSFELSTNTNTRNHLPQNPGSDEVSAMEANKEAASQAIFSESEVANPEISPMPTVSVLQNVERSDELLTSTTWTERQEKVENSGMAVCSLSQVSDHPENADIAEASRDE